MKFPLDVQVLFGDEEPVAKDRSALLSSPVSIGYTSAKARQMKEKLIKDTMAYLYDEHPANKQQVEGIGVA